MIAKLRKKIAIAALLAALSMGGGAVEAQDADAPAAAEEVETPLRTRANVSATQMETQARKYLGEMQVDLKRVLELQVVARNQKDVIKLNCVNDKLLQVKQLLNIGDTAIVNMQQAASRGDEEARYHEFGRMTIATQQVQVLSSEAENCIGEDLSFLGPTEVTVETPEQPDDPTADPTPQFPEVEPPPVASPFL